MDCEKQAAVGDIAAHTKSQTTSLKKSPGVSVENASITAVSTKSDTKASTITWRPSWRRLGPLSGLFALVIGACCVLFSFAILWASNGAAVENWRYQPSSYLAVVTAAINGATRYAAVQGAVTAWWLRAIRGSTLARLHYDWAAIAAPWRALISRRAINWLLLPCIASIVIAVDGPLLQGASNVVSAPFQDATVYLQVDISPQVPRGYSGYYQYSPVPYSIQPLSGPSYDSLLYDGPSVNDLQKDWIEGNPTSGFVRGCPSKCRGKIQAPALRTVSCAERSYKPNYLGLSPLESWKQTNQDPPLENYAFMAFTGFRVEDEELMNLTIVHSDVSQTDCSGKITVRNCLLGSAIGLYDVEIDDGKAVPISPNNPEILKSSNNSLSTSGAAWPSSNYTGWTKSTLAGLVGAAQLRYGSMVMYINPDPSPNATKQDVQPIYAMNQYFTTQFVEARNGDKPYPVCASYRDPTDVMMGGLNDLLFRVGVSAAKSQNYSVLEETSDPGVKPSQNITGDVIGSHNVYKPDFWYFLGATLVEVCCMGLILPLYWGWWRLGRPVSFSPLEIAKAFDAPILRNVDSNLLGRRIADEIGDAPIQYGTKRSTRYANDGAQISEEQMLFLHPHNVSSMDDQS